MPAKASSATIFPWKRFWTPWTKAIRLEGGRESYLADPEARFSGNSHLKELASFKLEEPGCLVLCGEPGMGKTQTVGVWLAQKQSPTVPLSVDFRNVPDRQRFDELVFAASSWKSWESSTDIIAVVVDGVDEGLIKIPGFLDYLTDRLRSAPVERLRLVLTCRSLDWPVTEGERLMALWPKRPAEQILELCPLRRKDVAQAARLSGLKSQALMSAVHREGLVAFATRPLTLRMLLDSFRAGRGFAGTRGDLIRAHTRTLCEIEPERRRRLQILKPSLARYTTDDIYRAARGIAALLLLGGRASVHTGPRNKAQPGDLPLDDIVASFSDGNPHGAINRETVTLALESPLFSARGPNRMGVYHQVLAEVLAADFLRSLPLRQQIQLLGDRDPWGRYVEPPLAEVAGWLAADAPDFRAFLLENEPATLLRADVSKYPFTAKAAIVDTVLTRARDGRLFDPHDERRYYHGLRHPRLAAQLRPCLLDKSANLVARRLALTIAEECEVHSLFDDVVARLNDVSDTKIHHSAAFALRKLARPDDKGKLLRLVASPQNVDSSTPLASALALLENGLVPLRQLIPALHKLVSGALTNGHLLAQYAKPADASALLDASARWHGRPSNPRYYGPLKTAAFNLGIAQWNQAPVRQALAKAWLASVRPGNGVGDEIAKAFKDAARNNAASRRRFLAELADHTPWQHHELAAIGQHLIDAEDFPWLLKAVFQCSGRRRQNYGRLIGWLYQWQVHYPHLGEVLKVIKQVPAAAAQVPWMRLWPLDDPTTAQSKKYYYEYGEGAPVQKPPPPTPVPRDLWAADAAALAGRPGKHPTFWARLSYNLFYDGERHASGLPNDVTRAPGWKRLTPTQRKACMKSARRFLLKVRPEKKTPGTIDNYDIGAYLAIKLLYPAWKKSDRSLQRAIQRKWLLVLVRWWEDDKAKAAMIASMAALAPERLLQVQRATLDREAADNSPIMSSLRDYRQCWTAPMRRNVLHWAMAKPRPAGVLRALARELMKIDTTAVRELWVLLARKKKTGVAERAALLGPWMAHNLAQDWPQIHAALQVDDGLAREALLMAAGEYDGALSERKALRAKPALIADLYLLVHRLFPPSPTDYPAGGGAVTPLMDLARWRDSLTGQLAALGNKDACRELERIAAILPTDEAIWTRWKLYDAIVAMRRRAWQPVAPAAIGQMAADADSVFLRSEDDLLALVVESLERMAATPDSLVQRFWVEKKIKGRKVAAPDREERITELIASWLRSNLDPRRAIMIQREVHVQRKHRTDLEVRTVGVKGSKLRPLEVTIEVKGDWNAEVRSAARGQLVDRYLRRAGRTHGIYLVVWTGDARLAHPKGISSTNMEQARADLALLVKHAVLPGENFVVAGVLIDARNI